MKLLIFVGVGLLPACFPNPKDLPTEPGIDSSDSEDVAVVGADVDATTPDDAEPNLFDGSTTPDVDPIPSDAEDAETTQDIGISNDTGFSDVDSTPDVSVETDGEAGDVPVVPPRCPGGSVVFSWGDGAADRIEIDSEITAREYLPGQTRMKTYECPDDFVGVVTGEPSWSSPLTISWYQPFGFSPSWRNFAVSFNQAATLWDYITQDGQAAPNEARLPSGHLFITSSTGATRDIPLKFIRPRNLQGYPNETPPYELLAFETNESPSHGFKLDINGIGQDIRVDFVSLRVAPNTAFSPELQYPSQWNNNYYTRGAGQLRIYNPCSTQGERAYFGRRDVWTWYASGNNELKSMSLRFIGPNGLEQKRYNIFDALPAAYGPAYDACSGGAQEVIVFDFTLIENG